MSQTSFQKYIGTTIAKDISEETRIVIMENLSELDGVSIEDFQDSSSSMLITFPVLLTYTVSIPLIPCRFEAYGAAGCGRI